MSTNNLLISGSDGVGGTRFDDLCIDNAEFHGDVRIITLFPNGDTGTNNWTRSTGTGLYSDHINEVATDDTTYLETNTSANTISCTIDNLPAGIETVIAINPLVRAWKTDAGSQNIKVSTNVDGPATHVVTDSSTFTNDIYTGHTPTTVDALTVIVEYE